MNMISVLILDEVQCGMGRTGTIMTYFQYDILPDIVCLAKGIGCGIPVGAFVANAKMGTGNATRRSWKYLWRKSISLCSSENCF